MDRFDSTEFIKTPTSTSSASKTSSAERNQFQAILERNYDLLSEDDRICLKRARQVFLSHSVAGGYTGLVLGLAFAFRSRIFFKGPAIFPKLTPYVPKLGATELESIAAAKQHSFVAGERTRKVIYKALGWGLTGAIAGLQMGIFTGSRAGKGILSTRPGVEERGGKAIRDSIEEAQKTHHEEYLFYNRPSELLPLPEGGVVEGDELNGTLVYGEGDFDNQKSSRADKATEPSRWDALRSESKGKSAWDAVRNSDKIRSNSSTLDEESLAAKRRNKVRPPGMLPDPGSDEMYDMISNKEDRNKSYERMLEKERLGPNPGGFQ